MSEETESKEKDEWREELERRNLGKKAAEAQSKKEESEIRELAMKRKHEKRENEAYLRRLREQIKADKYASVFFVL